MEISIKFEWKLSAELASALIDPDLEVSAEVQRQADLMLKAYAERFPGLPIVFQTEGEPDWGFCEIFDRLEWVIDMNAYVIGDLKKTIDQILGEAIDAFKRPADWPSDQRMVSLLALSSQISQWYHITIKPTDMKNMLIKLGYEVTNEATVEL